MWNINSVDSLFVLDIVRIDLQRIKTIDYEVLYSIYRLFFYI